MNIQATCTTDLSFSTDYPHRGLVIDADTGITMRRTLYTYRTPEQAIEAAERLIEQMMEKVA